MADTISALDTASTDELIAALMSRHKATLGQVCQQLEDTDTLLQVAHGLDKSLLVKIKQALGDTTGHYILAHSAWKDVPDDKAVDALMRLLGIPSGPKRPPSPPSFGFGPFGRG